MVGILLFWEETGKIDFLGVHPQYRKQGIAKAFLRKVTEEFDNTNALTVTTFREGDKADTGYREEWKNLGFREGKEKSACQDFTFLVCGRGRFSVLRRGDFPYLHSASCISSMRIFVLLILFLFTLPLVLGERGVWLAVPMAELATLYVSIAFMRRYKDMDRSREMQVK